MYSVSLQRLKVDWNKAPGENIDQVSRITLYRVTQRRFPPKYIENTFQAIQSTFSSLEMHSKRCYKICTCSVVLGQLESFRNYKGFRNIFPKILDAILRK